MGDAIAVLIVREIVGVDVALAVTRVRLVVTERVLERVTELVGDAIAVLSVGETEPDPVEYSVFNVDVIVPVDVIRAVISVSVADPVFVGYSVFNVDVIVPVDVIRAVIRVRVTETDVVYVGDPGVFVDVGYMDNDGVNEVIDDEDIL